MTDSSNQSDGTFISDLNQRLVKRATEPMGIIDVRYGQQKYFRIARWLAGRSSLFADLMKRYGVEEATAYGEHPLAIQRALDQTGNLFSTTSQSFSPTLQSEAKTFTTPADAQPHQAGLSTKPSGLAEVLAEHSSKSVTQQPVSQPPATPESKFRISRQPPPMLPKSDVAMPMRKATRDTPLSSPPSAAISLPVESAPAAGQLPGEVRVNETRVLQEVQVNDTQIHESRMNTDPKATQTVDFVFRKKHAEISEEKKTDVPSGVSAKEKIVSAQAPVASAQPLPTGLQEKPASSTTNNEPIGAPSTTVQQDTRTPATVPLVAALSPRTPLTTPPRQELVLSIQNQEDDQQAHAGNVATQKPATDARPSGLAPAVAMTPEIRADSGNREMPDIIWRKPADDIQSTDTSAPKSTASSIPGADGLTYNASALTAQQNVQADSMVRVQTERPQVQVEQVSPQVIRVISEQVLRTITLDLKLERERRGVTKWR